jgi:hypothetical protein
MSASAQQLEVLSTAVERRFYPRIAPRAPIFLALGESKECLLMNVGENGLLVSTPAELRCNFVARISISLNGLPKPVRVNARVVWTSEGKELAGIQLLDLSDHDREQIRKWGEQESRKSWQPEPKDPLAAGAPSLMLSETTRAMSLLTEPTPFTRPPDADPAAAPRKVRTRTASAAAGIATWGVLIATVSLAAAFFLRNGAPGNFFGRSTEKGYEDSAAAPQAQDIQGSMQNSDTPSRGMESQAASTAPNAGVAKSESDLPATPVLQNSLQTGNTSPEDGPEGSLLGAGQDQADGSRMNSTSLSEPTVETEPTPEASDPMTDSGADAPNVSSPPGDIPAVADAAPKASGTAGSSSASGDAKSVTLPAVARPTAREAIRNSLSANNVGAGRSATIGSSPIVPSTPPAYVRKPDGGVIQMDTPERQVLEIHLPRGYQAPFFDLPGERVLESPSVTMHIQRSVHIPTTHVGWASHRNKRVIVGGLVSRVDPQAGPVQSSGGDSVLVKAMVDKDGRIESVRPIHGSSNLVLAVAKAVREWRYQPTLIDNKPVETECYVVAQFHAPARRAARR